jgi:hypothetical protein
MGGPGMSLDDALHRDTAVGVVLFVGGLAILAVLAWGLWRRSGG